MRGFLIIVFFAVFAALVSACFAWPAAAAIAALMNFEAWADAGIGPRRLGLIARGVGVATAAALFAQVIGAGLACGLTGRGADRTRGLVMWVCLCVLLTPPYIYAYGWSLPLLPQGLPIGDVPWLATTGRAIWCLATWSSPLAAFTLAAGWRAHGRPAFDMALLDADGMRAARRAALPLMRPWLAISFVCTWVLTFTEYSVCHLCLVQTWNTEILAELQLLETGGGGFALAWPLLAIIAAAMVPLVIWRRRLRELLDDLALLDSDGHAAHASIRFRWPRRLIVGSAVIAILLPWAVFAAHMRDPAAFLSVWSTYPGGWPNSLLCAAVAALMSVVLAVGLDFLLQCPKTLPFAVLRWTGWLVLAASAIAAFSAPALVGDAFAAAYAQVPAVGDHWPIVSLVSATRFSLIAIAAMLLSGRSVHPQFAGMAASDGASIIDAYVRVRLPLCLPMLSGAAVATALLALTEVAATIMIQPPAVPNLAVTLLNQIHFGRNDQVIAMSLLVMTCVAVAVALLGWIRNRTRRSAHSARSGLN